jgi:chitinase
LGETVACHHTNPRKSSYGKWSCEEAADYYLSRGVPSTKIFIGGAFYSRGFANTDGLGKPSSGGSPDKSWEAGSVDYKDLPLNGASEFVDPESKAAYSYDPQKRVLNSYDNKDSLIEKCKIIYEKNLGGIIIWENSGDKRDYNDSRNLTKVLRDNLTHGRPTGTTTPPLPPQIPSIPTLVPVASGVTASNNCNGNCQCMCQKFKGVRISFDVNWKDGQVSNTSVNFNN